jgi:hypothetical protein
MARAATVLWVQACLLPLATLGGCSGQAGAPAVPAATSAEATGGGKAAADAKLAGAKPHTVELIIDYGDGVQKRFTDIGWRESMTVLDVLKAAQDHSHGISFSARSSGDTAMMTKLDDEKNQGGAADAKNWIFRINGRMGDESCGIAEVRPGDTVLWKFGLYE